MIFCAFLQILSRKFWGFYISTFFQFLQPIVLRAPGGSSMHFLYSFRKCIQLPPKLHKLLTATLAPYSMELNVFYT